MEGKIVAYIVMAALILAVIGAAGYVAFAGARPDARAAINETLVGMTLTYSNIAGQPMNYTIGPEDIVSVTPVQYKGGDAWKVRVGEGLAWDVTLDADGKNVLEIEQLFRT